MAAEHFFLQGQYQSLTGQTSCDKCVAGKYRSYSDEAESCKTCPDGTISPNEGQSNCVPCDAVIGNVVISYTYLYTYFYTYGYFLVMHLTFTHLMTKLIDCKLIYCLFKSRSFPGTGI